MAAARAAPIPFQGELGSINPVVITAAADAARGPELASGLVGSVTLGSGQFCAKPGVVFLPEGSQVERQLASLPVPPAHVMLTSSIAKGFATGVQNLLSIPGVELVSGTPNGPLVVSASLETLDAHTELLGEVSGPVTVLVRYGSDERLLASLDILVGSLRATLHSEPSDETEALIERLERVSGRVLFAGGPTGVAVTWSAPRRAMAVHDVPVHVSGRDSPARFLRPIAYQDALAAALPPLLREDNPLGIPRRVDGALMGAA